MADYIYLLQNRLTSAQRRALEAVRDAARAHGLTVFLVGGAVRDLSSGAPVRDLDFAIQGETEPLLADLTASGGAIAGKNPVLSSVYLTFPGGVRVEVGPTLTVHYPKPGQPETQPATILDDLRRRDFTANAMAISLNEGSYGLLLDPLNGIADLENRELRLVSNYGFIEQPSLLLRAARIGERLGWTMEERTASRYAAAKEENFIAAMSQFDRGYELEEIAHEEDPLGALEHLQGEGWAEALYPAWTPAKADREGLERMRDAMGQLEGLGIHVDPSAAFFPLLTAKMTPDEVAGLKALFVRPGFVQQIETLEARSKELAGQITGKASAAPSSTWKQLFAAEPEVVLWLAYSTRSGAVQGKLKAFINEWPQMRQRIPYALMQEMRITPELPGYEQLLEDLFFALMDDKLSTPEATRAFLEPFSPPAPVAQAAPRRRPAKSARSRSRKAIPEIAAEEVAAEPDESADSEDQDETGVSGRFVAEPEITPEPEPEPKPEPVPVPVAKKAVPEPAAATPAVKAVAKKEASPVALEAAKKTAGTKVVAGAKTAGKESTAPAKATAAPAKAATSATQGAAKVPTPVTKVAAKAAPQKASARSPVAKEADSKAASPAKTSAAASKKSPAKKVAGSKAAPPLPVAKQVAKKTPAKAVKRPAKGSSPAKGQSTGRGVQAKTSAVKKTAAVKVAAKAAKRPVPAKKASAPAAKGKSRR